MLIHLYYILHLLLVKILILKIMYASCNSVQFTYILVE